MKKNDPEGRIKTFLKDGSQNMQLKVVENVGEAGDVVLFDPRIFHAEVSRNVSETPRMVMRIDYARRQLPGVEYDASCTPTLQKMLMRARQSDDIATSWGQGSVARAVGLVVAVVAIVVAVAFASHG